jgi:hypothetical protein
MLMLAEDVRALLEGEEPKIVLFMEGCVQLAENPSHADLFPRASPEIPRSMSEFEGVVEKIEKLKSLELADRVSTYPVFCDEVDAIFALRSEDCVFEDLYAVSAKNGGQESLRGVQFYDVSQKNGVRSYRVARVGAQLPARGGPLIVIQESPIDHLEVHVRSEGKSGEPPTALHVKVFLEKQEFIEEARYPVNTDTEDLKIYRDFDKTLEKAQGLSEEEAKASLATAIRQLPLKEYAPPFGTMVDNLFLGPEDHETEIRKLRERLWDAAGLIKRLRKEVGDRLPAVDLIQKMESVAGDGEMYEVGEEKPSEHAKSAARNIIRDAWRVGDLLIDGEVSTFYGELNITWRVGDRQVRLICFSEEERPPAVYREQVNKGSLGDYELEPNVTSEVLAGRLNNWIRNTP